MARTVFISYRRADTEVLAARLNRAFTERFGDERIFFDRDDIAQGTQWRERVAAQLARADTVVALIGTRWQPLLDERLASGADDVLRFELATALAARKTVLPVLADGAAMPGEAALPPDLRALARVQAAQLSSDRFDDDVRALLLSLRMPWSVALGWACANSFAWVAGALLAVGAWSLGTRLPEGSVLSWVLTTLAGALFALVVGGAQWLVLRRWWTGLGWLPLAQAACGGLAAAAAVLASQSPSALVSGIAGTVSFFALPALPLLTWLAMRRRIDGAGWFNLMNVVSPLAAMLAAPSLRAGNGDDGGAAVLSFAAIFAANLLSGVLLMLLLRRAGRRGR